MKATIHDVECDGETDLAIHVTDGTEDFDMWVPKSVIHDDSEVYQKGDSGSLVVKGGWAQKNGFELD